jgi:hypothetical protein
LRGHVFREGLVGGAEPVREYRRRRQSPGELGRLCVPLVLVVFYVARSLQKNDPLARWLSVGCLVMTVGVLAWALLFLRRAFTRVDASGVAIHGVFRVRRIPWSEIYELGVRRPPRAVRDGAFVGTMSGRRRSLPRVNERQGERLRAEMAVLREIGTGYGGRTWERMPVVEHALRRRAGRTRSVSKALAAAVKTWLVMAALFAVLLVTGGRPSAPLLLLWMPVAALVFFMAFFWRRRETHAPRERDAW